MGVDNMLSFLMALMKSFLQLGGIHIALILCLVVGILYLVIKRRTAGIKF